tara:strand:+ start:219 stop:710 length:492 start_codon:yes stop_codon:yes gene_type:complete
MISAIQKLNTKIGKLVSWGLLLMVVLTCIIVILRYVFNIGFIWMQELVRFLYASVFLICAAFTFSADEHVRVDIIYSRLSIKKKKIVNLFGNILLLLPVCVTILLYSFNYVVNSWIQLEGSLEERGLHLVYIMKSFIWIFAIMLIIEGINQIINNIKSIFEKS